MIKDLTESQIKELLKNNVIGSLGFIAQNSPYVLPATYYFDSEQNTIISYAMEGHKIDAMREFPEVSLMVFENESLHNWRSVLVHGIYEELHQIDAKFYLHEFSKGIHEIIGRKGGESPTSIEDFSSKTQSGGIPIVYRIRISDWTGKRRDD